MTKMKNVNVFVDVDLTLVDAQQVIRPGATTAMQVLFDSGCHLFLRSTGGGPYCRQIAERYGIAHLFEAFLPKPDIYIDDMPATIFNGLVFDPAGDEDWVTLATRIVREHVHQGERPAPAGSQGPMICILEDDPARVARFRAVAARIAPDATLRIWPDAHRMLSQLPDCLDCVVLMSLDHDLHPAQADAADPGSGYDVAKVLGELIPCCPIIIHTSNGERGTWMEGELSRAGWKYARVHPFADEWIEKEWAALVERFLRASA